MLPIIAIPTGLKLIVAALAANEVRKRCFDKEDKILIEDSDEPLTKNEMEIIPSVLAILYAFANIDGIHPKEKQEVEEIKKLFDETVSVNKRYQHEVNLVKQIESKSDNITLNEALQYLPSKRDKIEFCESLKEEIENIIQADEKRSPEEEFLLRVFEMFIDNKLKSLDELKDFKVYLLKDEKNSITQSGIVEVITLSCNEFRNIDQLEVDKYYISHPKNKKHLIQPDDLLDVEEFVKLEMEKTVAMLGAKSYYFQRRKTISKKDQEKSSSDRNVGMSGKTPKSKKESGFGGDKKYKYSNESVSNSDKTESYQMRFESGQKESKELVFDSLVWLKDNKQIKSLIESRYSSNPVTFKEIEISSKEYINSNKNLKTLYAGNFLLPFCNFETSKEDEDFKNMERMEETTYKFSVKF